MTEYGRIHTDGSRSGGQPVLKPCPFCGEQCATLIVNQGDKWAHYEPTCLEVRTGYNLSDNAPWRDYAIAAWNTRQPTQIDALREALRFYAREANYRSTTVYMSGQSGKTAIEIDTGSRAIAALQEQSK